jgi:hypothetical protein
MTFPDFVGVQFRADNGAVSIRLYRAAAIILTGYIRCCGPQDFIKAQCGRLVGVAGRFAPAKKQYRCSRV